MKSYVFPVQDGVAYMGVKSTVNPYNPGAYWWCAGCPNVFGGDDDGDDPFITCHREAAEESHWKLDLNAARITFMEVTFPPNGIRSSFYYATGFDYDQYARLPAGLAIQAKYRETTGEVLLLDLEDAYAHVGSNAAMATWMLMQLWIQFGGRNLGAARDQFVDSVTVTVFRRLVQRNAQQPIG